MSEEKKIKLVIWDADDTLWNGTVFYTDKEAIQIKPGTESALKELDKRGIINTLCSKNDYKDADAMLKKFEIDKYFKEPQIGWGLKSEAIKKLADIFKCSFEEILFIDDDPFQRAEVASQIANLNIIELTDPIDVLNIPGVRPDNETEEDRNRTQILKEDRDRREAEKAHGVDYRNFLRQCDIKMTVREIADDDWPRVVQLLNRTNELNATGNRYSLEELKKSYEANGDKIFVAELVDKFGNYGLIAELIIDTREPEIWSIRDLTVSCRTMGRGIGSNLTLAALNLAKASGIKSVVSYIRPTGTNWRMRPLFEKRGFQKIFDDGTIKRYKFDLEDNKIIDYSDWLDITIK